MNTILSVIIPVYGVEKYIARCAHSLFSQTMQEGIEFIFIDDCTPDRSIDILCEVLEQYPHRKAQTRIVSHADEQRLARCSSAWDTIGEGRLYYSLRFRRLGGYTHVRNNVPQSHGRECRHRHL